LIFSFMLLSTSCYFYPRSDIYIETNPEKEKTTLKFISSWGGADPQAETLNDILTEFMENNKDVEIINESVSGDDFLTKIKADFASGYDPDVFGLWPGSDIDALIKAGKVADLTELLENDPEWKNNFKDDGWSYTTYEGSVYGVPFERIFEGLFINKDMFEQNNIKIPNDFEELKEAVIKFRARNKIPIALNFRSEGTYLYQNILAVLGGKYVLKDPIIEGTVKDCYIDAMKYMKELHDLGAFPSYEEALNMDNKTRDNMFLNKEAAMIAQGSWFIGKIRENQDSYDIIPFPKISDGVPKSPTMIYGLGCGTFYISKNAWENEEKREAAIKLLKALTSRKSAQLFSFKTGMICNLNTDIKGMNYNELTLRGLELINNAKELVGPPDSYVDRTAWEEIIVTKIPYVLEGKNKPVEVWNEYLEHLKLRGLIN